MRELYGEARVRRTSDAQSLCCLQGLCTGGLKRRHHCAGSSEGLPCVKKLLPLCASDRGCLSLQESWAGEFEYGGARKKRESERERAGREQCTRELGLNALRNKNSCQQRQGHEH